jgi:hypothetical protein
LGRTNLHSLKPLDFAYLYQHYQASISVMKDMGMGLPKKTVGKEYAEAMKERLYRALPFPTALQNKALIKLAQAAATLNSATIRAFRGIPDDFIKTII